MKDIHISDNKIFLQIRTSTTWFSFSTNLAHLAYPSMPLALSQTFQLLSPGETAQIVRSAFPQSVSLGFLRRGAQSLLSQDTLAGRIQQMLLERMPYCFCEFCGKSQKLIPGCVTLIKKKSLLLFHLCKQRFQMSGSALDQWSSCVSLHVQSCNGNLNTVACSPQTKHTASPLTLPHKHLSTPLIKNFTF